MDDDLEEKIARAIDALILKGLIEVNSIDPQTGEFMYQITPELVNMMPWFAEESEKMFLDHLDDLWVKGFITMDKFEENPEVRLTTLAFDQDSVDKLLTSDERVVLMTVMEAMRRKEE